MDFIRFRAGVDYDSRNRVLLRRTWPTKEFFGIDLAKSDVYLPDIVSGTSLRSANPNVSGSSGDFL